ncbi:MAG: ATP phosphoribosyltransferase [Candidatus Margulisbacteria bacterium]|nr:ATP phosphoribosyltransferase [Candidatus Margulisiibacteriota bacterium]
MSLTIALSKGYLLTESLKVLKKIGIEIEDPESLSRKLSFYDKSKQYKFLVIRPTDVPVYVEHGAADIGIAGKDILVEGQESVAELLDLKFGYCRLVVAALKGAKNIYKPNIRIATKFINSTEEFFKNKGIKAEIIKLYGSVELAPKVGLAEAVVDLVATGSTLKENGLEIMETILESTARLIANKVRLRINYSEIYSLASKIQSVILKK